MAASFVAGGVYLTRDVYVEVARTGWAKLKRAWNGPSAALVPITSFLTNGDQRVHCVGGVKAIEKEGIVSSE